MPERTIEQKVDDLTSLMTEMVERQRRQQELIEDMSIIGREILATATVRLDDAEQAGWFAMGGELVAMLRNIVEAYEPEDVRALGNSAVTILDTVRAVTQPEVMALVAEAGEALQHGDEVEPKSPWEMLGASRDPDVQRGLAVMIEVLKQVGRASNGLRPPGDVEKARHKRLLDKRTRPRHARAVGTAAAIPVPEVAPEPEAKAPPIELPGWELDAEGFLADPHGWTEDFARQMAAALGVAELTERHWDLLRFARREWETRDRSPNIRRLTQGSGISTRELYDLWPSAPGKATARVAGIPKPYGCV